MTDRKHAIKICKAIDKANSELWESLIDGREDYVRMNLVRLQSEVNALVPFVKAIREAEAHEDPAIAKSVSDMSAAMARSGGGGHSSYVGKTHPLGSRTI